MAWLAFLKNCEHNFSFGKTSNVITKSSMTWEQKVYVVRVSKCFYLTNLGLYTQPKNYDYEGVFSFS